MTDVNQVPGLKDPARAATLATIYPPAGYWYAGKKFSAIFAFFAEDIMYAMIPLAGLGLVCMLLFRLYCRWEVRKIVEKANQKKIHSAIPAIKGSL